MERIDASGLMWAADILKAMHNNLARGATVTKFVLGGGTSHPIEFEVVVTKMGTARVGKTLPLLARSAK